MTERLLARVRTRLADPNLVIALIFVIIALVVFGVSYGVVKFGDQGDDIKRIVERLDERDVQDEITAQAARQEAVDQRMDQRRAIECLLQEMIAHRAVSRLQTEELTKALGIPLPRLPALPDALPSEQIDDICAPYYGHP